MGDINTNATLLLILVIFGEKVVDIIKPWFQPIFNLLVRWFKLETDDYPKMIFSAVLIGVLAYFTEANLLEGLIPSYAFGRAITIIACAGGSSKLHDLWKLIPTIY